MILLEKAAMVFCTATLISMLKQLIALIGTVDLVAKKKNN